MYLTTNKILVFTLVLLHFWTCTVAYRADVVLMENGKVDRKQFEVVDGDVAPFRVPQNSLNKREEKLDVRNGKSGDITGLTTSKRKGFRKSSFMSDIVHTGVKVTGIFGVQNKASQGRRWKHCISKHEDKNASNSVVTVEKGESVTLPCHDCESFEAVKYEGRQWIKLDSFPDKHGLYRVREVISDLHDDLTRNRVVIEMDHSLLIRKVKKKDTGSYFCKKIGDTKQPINVRLSWSDLNDWLIRNVSMNHYYHLDVLDLNKEHFVDIFSENDTSINDPQVLSSLNLLIQTRWTPWSDCNVCGDEGVRKRIGLCVVKKLDFRKNVPEVYLDRILDFAHDGLLCKSEYLKQFSNKDWLKRPNKVLMGECNVKCDSERLKRESAQPERISGKKMKKPINKTLEEEDHLVMICPGATIRDTATWVKGPWYFPLMKIKKTTNLRIYFDHFGNLLFKHVKMSDAGEYACWVKQKMRQRFVITVTPNYLREVHKYFGYLLIAFAIDFGIFVFLTIIKFFNRKFQSRKRKNKPNVSSSSSDSDTSSSSNSSRSSSSADSSKWIGNQRALSQEKGVFIAFENNIDPDQPAYKRSLIRTHDFVVLE